MFTSERRWPRQLLALGALSALLTLAAAGLGILALSQTVRTGHKLGELSRAQSYHQDADMQHDALRTDVALAQQAGPEAPLARRAELQRRAERDAALMRRDLANLRRVELPSTVGPTVESLHGSREAYAALAVQIVRSTLRGQRDPEAESRFEDAFEKLRIRQAALTRTLTNATTEVEREQSEDEARIATALVVAAAVVLAGWALLIGMIRRAGMRLFQALNREAEQRRVADELQRCLLPERLPDIPGLRLAARSRPANSTMRVGGDWYDVISLPSGDVGLVVGDVVGHDLRAAAAMAQLRAALRSFAVYEPSPAAVLTRVNTVADLLQVTELTTCLYAVVNPSTRTVRWSSAGHLNPLAVPALGHGQVLDGDPGPPIGVADDALFVDRICRLEPRGALLLYSDGLVERRSSSISENLTRLESVRGPHGDPERLCDHVLEFMLADDPDVMDDVTVLALEAA